MKFVWDPAKEKINIRKHRVNFTESCYVFSDPYILTQFDEEHSTDEDRWITMGEIPTGKIVVVVHTYRKLTGGEVVRIISARQATKSEARTYHFRRR